MNDIVQALWSIVSDKVDKMEGPRGTKEEGEAKRSSGSASEDISEGAGSSPCVAEPRGGNQPRCHSSWGCLSVFFYLYNQFFTLNSIYQTTWH